MSHLDRPRITFFGEFHTDPSTINNYVPNYSSGSVQDRGWGPNGLHNFRFDCPIVRVVPPHPGRPTMSSQTDALVGGRVLTLDTPSQAKLVDLDPRYQRGSEIFGAKLAIRVGGATLAFGPLETMTLRDLWVGRVTNQQLSPFERAGGAFYSRMRRPSVTPLAGSPTFAALASARHFAVKLVVYAYSRSSLSGKIAGTIAPWSPSSDRIYTGFVGRRLQTASPDRIVRDFGVAEAKLDAAGQRLTIDIGNAIPESAVGGSRIDVGQLELRALTGGNASELIGPLDYSTGHFERTAGVEEIENLGAAAIRAATSHPLALYDTRRSRIVLSERPSGLDVEMFEPVIRMQPSQISSTLVFATRFGAPASGVALTATPVASADSNAGGLAEPQGPTRLTTTTDGSARLRIRAARLPAQSGQHLDGEVYEIDVAFAGPGTAAWGTRTNVRVYEDFQAPASPRWSDVEPILQQYERLYPGMSRRMPSGLGGHATYQNPGYRQVVLNYLQYALSDPRYMPVTRDLSEAKRRMLIAWLNAGAP